MKNIYDKIQESRKTGRIEFLIEERRDDCVISTMPVKEGILNPFGTVQAGAMLWLADVTATVLALRNVEIGPDGKGFPLAINLNTAVRTQRQTRESRAHPGDR
jgi:1,4-dihydroxy-2-naphthoyl-CoA hydrolase